jgi:hypothetical protein
MYIFSFRADFSKSRTAAVQQLRVAEPQWASMTA